MPSFKLTGPDGKNYNVEAESEQEAQSRLERAYVQLRQQERVAQSTSETGRTASGYVAQPRMPLGTQFEPGPQEGQFYSTPTGLQGYVSGAYSTTDPEELARMRRGELPGEMYQQRMAEDIVRQNPMTAYGSSFSRGVPFVGSYLDEAAGMISPEAEARAKTMQQSMQRAAPLTDIALQTTSGILGTGAGMYALPARATTPLLRTGERALYGVLTGGLEGAISGYGEGETPEQRKQRALSGSMLGAATGAFGGGVQGAIESVAMRDLQNIGLPQLAKELNISEKAAGIVRSTIIAGGDLAAAQRRIRDLGEEFTLASAGPATAVLLDASAAQGGAALTELQRAMPGMRQQSRQSMETTLDETLGTRGLGVKTIVEEAGARTKEVRDEAYSIVYGKPISYATGAPGEEVLGVLDRISPRIKNQALIRANEMMAADLNIPKSRQINFVLNDDGTVSIEELPNVMQLDYIKRALGNIAEDSKDPITGVLKDEGIAANLLYGQLNNAIENAVPGYRAAVNLGMDTIQERQAIRLGTQFFGKGTTIEDITRLLASANTGARAQIKESLARMVRTNIDETISRARATIANPDADLQEVKQAVSLLSSRDSQNKLKLILPKAEVDKLMQELERGIEVIGIEGTVARGSATASRQALQRQVEQATQPGVIQSLATGDIPGSARKVVQNLTGQTENMAQEELNQVFADIARSLINTRGAEARRIIGLIRKYQNTKNLSEAEAIEIARAYGTIGAAPSAITEEFGEIRQ
jgi:hypothetical protein